MEKIKEPNLAPIESVRFKRGQRKCSCNRGQILLTRNKKHRKSIFVSYPGTFANRRSPSAPANRKYEELSYSKIPKMRDPILENLLKMRPHYSQSSRENATLSSGTSPLASYKEVPPPTPHGFSRLSRLGKVELESSSEHKTSLILLLRVGTLASTTFTELRSSCTSEILIPKSRRL